MLKKLVTCDDCGVKIKYPRGMFYPKDYTIKVRVIYWPSVPDTMQEEEHGNHDLCLKYLIKKLQSITDAK